MRESNDKENHDWIMRFIGSQITDPNILQRVEVMLKVDIIKTISMN